MYIIVLGEFKTRQNVGRKKLNGAFVFMIGSYKDRMENFAQKYIKMM